MVPLEDETVRDMVWSTSSLGPVLDASGSKDGEYFYPASATKGPFGVAFSVKDEAFEDIWIENGEENMMMTPEQFQQFAQSIIDKQSLQVDAIAGATQDSESIIRAIQQALAHSTK